MCLKHHISISEVADLWVIGFRIGFWTWYIDGSYPMCYIIGNNLISTVISRFWCSICNRIFSISCSCTFGSYPAWYKWIGTSVNQRPYWGSESYMMVWYPPQPPDASSLLLLYEGFLVFDTTSPTEPGLSFFLAAFFIALPHFSWLCYEDQLSLLIDWME